MIRRRNGRHSAGVGLVAVLLLAGPGCGPGGQTEPEGTAEPSETAAPAMAEPEGPDPKVLRERALAIFRSLPEEVPTDDNPLTQEKIDLGRQLYYDARLSLAQDISCNSCHQLDQYGVDNEPTSPGHEGQRGTRNSPSVYNAALHIAQFWDGRAATLEEQATGPVLNPVEMGMPSEDYVLTVLNSIPGYVDGFQAAFPGVEEPVTFENFGKAVGAFERRLMTPGPFDAFLAGDAEALDDEELAGLQTFIDAGCVTCHNGPAVGGEMFQKLGLVKPYPTEDLGRFEVTERENDKYVFKVPSLRNVTETGPYLHDGSISSLDEMIRVMGQHQLGKSLTAEEVASIRAFLGALRGEIDEAYVAKPDLPAAGPDTPAPEQG